MNTRTQIVNVVILVAFGIMLFVSIALAVGKLDNPKTAAHFQLTLSWLTNVIGLFVATVAALGLLLRSIVVTDLRQVAVFTLPLLAGLLLIQVHWSLAIALGSLALAIVAKETLVLFSRADAGTDAPSSDHTRQ